MPDPSLPDTTTPYEAPIVEDIAGGDVPLATTPGILPPSGIPAA